MKHLIPIILFLTSLLFFSCKNIVIKNSLSEQNIFGKVKTVTTSYYRVSKNRDSNGSYMKDTLLGKTTSTFDTSGNEIEKIQFSSNGKTQTESQFFYDENHHINKTKTKKINEQSHTIYNYEYSGNEQIEREYNQDGEEILKNIYKYNEQGQRTEKEIFNIKDEASKEKYVYLYDNKGNWIEYDKYKDTALVNKTFYEYDEWGNYTRIFLSERILRDFNNQQEEDEKYNKSLALDPSTPPPPPPPPPLDEPMFFKYFQFDKKNNWQKSVRYKGGLLIVEREIIYY